MRIDPDPVGGAVQRLGDDAMRLLVGFEPIETEAFIRRFHQTQPLWWTRGGSTNRPRLALALLYARGIISPHSVRWFLNDEEQVGINFSEPGGYDNYHLLAMVLILRTALVRGDSEIRDLAGRWFLWWETLNGLHYEEESGHIIMPRTRAGATPRSAVGEMAYAFLNHMQPAVFHEGGINLSGWREERFFYGAAAVERWQVEIRRAISRVDYDGMPLRWPLHFYSLPNDGWVSCFPRLGGFDNHQPIAVLNPNHREPHLREWYARHPNEVVPGGVSESLVEGGRVEAVIDGATYRYGGWFEGKPKLVKVFGGIHKEEPDREEESEQDLASLRQAVNKLDTHLTAMENGDERYVAPGGIVRTRAFGFRWWVQNLERQTRGME